MTDGQDGLVEIEGILEEQLIDGGAGWVCLTALGDWIFTIALRIHVESAPRQKNSLHGGEQTGDAILPLMEWNKDGCGAGGTKGSQIRRKRAVIVSVIATGRLGNGNVEAHSCNSVHRDAAEGKEYS
jgi:hypothetical protein